MAEKDPMLQKHPNFVKVDDKNHTILYKSPGPHRGSKGRSIDHAHATTKEQAEALIEEGWSETEDEAYELAGELKKARKRVAAAENEEEEEDDDADPITGAPAPAPAPTKKPKKAKK